MKTGKSRGFFYIDLMTSIALTMIGIAIMTTTIGVAVHYRSLAKEREWIMQRCVYYMEQQKVKYYHHEPLEDMKTEEKGVTYVGKKGKEIHEGIIYETYEVHAYKGNQKLYFLATGLYRLEEKKKEAENTGNIYNK